MRRPRVGRVRAATPITVAPASPPRTSIAHRVGVEIGRGPERVTDPREVEKEALGFAGVPPRETLG